jgi:hypothetical protein
MKAWLPVHQKVGGHPKKYSLTSWDLRGQIIFPYFRHFSKRRFPG